MMMMMMISRPACSAPAFTEHRQPKSFDLFKINPYRKQ